MRESVIVSAARTPIGSFQGALSTVSTPRLGAVAIRAAVERAGIAPESIDEVLMGCVLQSGLGQAPARQASIYAGLPTSVGATTVHKVCGSGLKAVILADQMIRSGDVDVIVAGGMENMSQAPYILPKVRTGLRLGHGEIVDSMIHDGLWDPYGDKHMGNCGEVCARERNISREEQDAFATESYRRANASIAEGLFKDEIAPVEIPSDEATRSSSTPMKSLDAGSPRSSVDCVPPSIGKARSPRPTPRRSMTEPRPWSS